MLKGFWRLCYSSCVFKSSVRNIINTNTLGDTKLPHIYSKTWTKSELIQYLIDNVVYETDEYIATRVPHGIALKNTACYLDSIDFPWCDTDLNEILKVLPEIFKVDSIFLTYYPSRNASGLVIFSKSHEAHKCLRGQIALAGSENHYIFSCLALVLGHPVKSLTQTFGVKAFKSESKYGTAIFEKWNNSKDIKQTLYHHEVLTSSEHVSLVKVELTCNIRHCARHILATKCLTPVLGDSYNYVKKESSLFGVPIPIAPSVVTNNAEVLNSELLAKLQLEPNAASLIPVHIHEHGIKVPQKKKKKFFVFVPPSETFIWTCHQLGLKDIVYFQ